MSKAKTTVYDRIISLMRSKGRKESDREFCRLLGISHGYLSQLRVSCAKNPERTIELDTASKFARELGVDVSVLLGEEESNSDNSDRFPSRKDAIVAARALQYAQTSIDSVYDGEPSGDDPGVLYWFHRIQAEESRRNNRNIADIRLVNKKSSSK